MEHLDPPINVDNLDFVEQMLEVYRRDPEALDPVWRDYFTQQLNETARTFVPRRAPFGTFSNFNPPATAGAPSSADVAEAVLRQDRVDQLIRAFRVRGHMLADVDPLGQHKQPHPELDYRYYGLTEEDLDKVFSSRTLSGEKVMTLRQILDKLYKTYCGKIGVQFMHIDDMDVKYWLQDRLEDVEHRRQLDHDEQLRTYRKLVDAEIIEQFLARKFPGSKRFSLEGAESLIPLLDLAVDSAGCHGVEEIVIAMAHRGRLNVLANILGKRPSLIFREFSDSDPDLYEGRGDVKYHLGYSTDRTTASGLPVHLTLCFNPSHLEFVGPVAQGRARAKQDRRGDVDHRKVMALVVHGDAAFIGEGVVQETLNLSELPGYRIGGTVHVILNNQIGFTTPPDKSRSTQYATDVAKMLQIPIFHVNGEDPNAVQQVINIAMDFRERFRKDVVIDMYCYRRHGHNEGDEPTFTQPLMYKAVRSRPSVREAYLENLLLLGGITREEADHIAAERRRRLDEELAESRQPDFKYREESGGGLWRGYFGGPESEAPDVDTGYDLEALGQLILRTTEVPAEFNLHRKLRRFFDNRRTMALGERPLDWGTAECAAYATLLVGGTRVRISGQDVGRGTFSHRHAILYDQETGEPYVPLQHLTRSQAPFQALDSPLSEAGVLGFEYGYSLDTPDGLIVWEAQFGDFANAAQVIIDQFISSSEDKWKRLSGIVLFLPHGFEGQGPEHSSARLERYLKSSAEDNWVVVNLTTPAQLFHCLRRQILRPWRKPLVVMSPKSLLRHPRCVSPLTDLASGRFQAIIPDPAVEPSRARRVILCTGKVYYDLLAGREERQCDDVALLRIEQLYPFHRDELEAHLRPYPAGTDLVWVQEEPVNMGAWAHIFLRLGERPFGRFELRVVARDESASPATGSARSHKIEQQRLVEAALAPAPRLDRS